MPTLAFAVSSFAALLTVSGIVYGLLALAGARDFMRQRMRMQTAPFIKQELKLRHEKAVDDIRAIVKYSKHPGHAPQKATIAPVDRWLMQAAKAHGQDIAGYMHVIDGSAVRHVINRHGNQSVEASRGQMAISEADFDRIPEVIESPDQVVLGTKTKGGKDQIGYMKRLQDGTTLYLEEARTGRKVLAMVSMRKYPATKDFDDIAATLPSNARSDGGNKPIIVLLPNVDNSGALHGMEAVSATASRDTSLLTPASGVSILKPLKGADPRMYAGFVSHCNQNYAGEWELLFGVSSLDDPAAADVSRLQAEYPHAAIRLIVCPERRGTNGKVSTLAQLLPHAQHDYIIVNDSDILVSPNYLSRIMAPFRDKRIGLVTAPYVGIASEGIWSRLEALGISTDFMPGVLTARKLEGGIRFGLGSTLATSKAALVRIGGFESLLEQLADDYELGARVASAGYRVELAREVVATTVPVYPLRAFCEHQLRWARSTRESRRAGYFGLAVTYVLPWAVLTVVASGGALWSFSLLSVALLVRVAVALSVGVGVLRDGQVLRDIFMLPLRDAFGLFFWAWSYAGDTVVWRGEYFQLKRGTLLPLDKTVRDRS